MTETLAHGYSSERTQQELSNEYQHDKVKIQNNASFVETQGSQNFIAR